MTNENITDTPVQWDTTVLQYTAAAFQHMHYARPNANISTIKTVNTDKSQQVKLVN